MALCDIDVLLEQACTNKFLCLTSEKEMLAVLLQLLCNASSGLTQQVFAGHGAPTTQVPAFGAGVYYDLDSKDIWYYNSETPGWE